MASDRKGTAQMECIRRVVTLSQIPETEMWLHHMAMKGLVLDHMCGGRFYFKKDGGQCLYYFLLSSDIGVNNEAWVYYEFLQTGGKRIPVQGSSFLIPRLALVADTKSCENNFHLYKYYYSYRNYRMLHRFIRNILVCMFGVLMCTFLYMCESVNLGFFLQYGGACLLLCVFHAFSLAYYRHSCKKQGLPCHWKKPPRPGYGSKQKE